MFSFSEIDHVAWFLLLLMGAWVGVNVLVDLSGDKTPSGESQESAEERAEKRH